MLFYVQTYQQANLLISLYLNTFFALSGVSLPSSNTNKFICGDFEHNF